MVHDQCAILSGFFPGVQTESGCVKGSIPMKTILGDDPQFPGILIQGIERIPIFSQDRYRIVDLRAICRREVAVCFTVVLKHFPGWYGQHGDLYGFTFIVTPAHQVSIPIQHPCVMIAKEI